MSQSDFDGAVEAYRQALDAFLKGDPKPVTAFFSRRDDVTLADLAGAIETLPAGQRAAFVLRKVQGLPYVEIAVALECTEEAARARVADWHSTSRPTRCWRLRGWRSEPARKWRRQSGSWRPRRRANADSV